jgi:hypothetical protein
MFLWIQLSELWMSIVPGFMTGRNFVCHCSVAIYEGTADGAANGDAVVENGACSQLSLSRIHQWQALSKQ